MLALNAAKLQPCRGTRTAQILRCGLFTETRCARLTTQARRASYLVRRAAASQDTVETRQALIDHKITFVVVVQGQRV